MLESKDLGQRYGKGPLLFSGLNLSVRPGEIVMVLGPNARGKTTLLKTLCGILPPAQGSVTHEGVVGYVPQAHQANLGYPVIEMVIMGRASKLRAYQNPGKRDREVAQAALERVGLAELAPRPFDQLSGGQRQLVLVARALAAEPTVLALDEPTSALDLRNQALVLRVVQQLRDDGLGLIITTHDPAHAYHVADSVLLLEAETKSVVGKGAALLTSERLSALYRTPIVVSSVQTEGGPQKVVVPYLGAPVRAPDAKAGRPTRASLASVDASARAPDRKGPLLGRTAEAAEAEQVERAAEVKRAERAGQAGQAAEAGRAERAERAGQAAEAEQVERAGQAAEAERAGRAAEAGQAAEALSKPNAPLARKPDAADPSN